MLTSNTQSQDNAITEHKNNLECARIDTNRKEMILSISKGHRTDPPKKWYKETCLQVDKDHPTTTVHQKKMMVLGMWNGMAKSVKIDVIHEYERWCSN